VIPRVSGDLGVRRLPDQAASPPLPGTLQRAVKDAVRCAKSPSSRPATRPVTPSPPPSPGPGRHLDRPETTRHRDVSTTQIYTPVLRRLSGGSKVRSLPMLGGSRPVDRRADPLSGCGGFPGCSPRRLNAGASFSLLCSRSNPVAGRSRACFVDDGVAGGIGSRSLLSKLGSGDG
jgi:hypothetical protein